MQGTDGRRGAARRGEARLALGGGRGEACEAGGERERGERPTERQSVKRREGQRWCGDAQARASGQVTGERERSERSQTLSTDMRVCAR